MTILVPITLFGWVPCVLLLFLWLPPRRAVITAFMAGWLLLPATKFPIPGIPDYSKMAATCAGILLAALFFDTDTLLSFRPKWVDLPMLIWCLCPFATNSSENIETYDSFSWSVNQIITWGMPYFIGRVYFNNAEAVRELAIGIIISGIAYIPVCLFEIRMSPQISKWLYGFDSGYSGMRLGGWRPAGLLASGLMLGMWMTSASLLGIWLWFTGSLKKIGKRNAGLLVLALFVVTIMCKSTGSLALLIVGLAGLFTIRFFKYSFPILLFCLPAIVYPAVRANRTWDGMNMVAFAESTVGADRAQSLRFRLKNEDLLANKAMDRFWWGWGRFARSRVLNEYGKDISTTDGLWIITFGTSGVVGLVCVTSIYLVPPIWFWWRTKAADWWDPSFAALAGFSVILTLYSVDNILNAMLNPVITVCMGAVATASLRRVSLEPLPTESVAESEPILNPRHRRTLWPPVEPVRTPSTPPWDREADGDRPSGRPHRTPDGPHWPR